MEQRRTCKLCLKTFSNGRALGGHMRSHMVQRELISVQWHPPNHGNFKLNCDGASKENPGPGTGAVLRNADGAFIAAVTRKIREGGALLAEAWAILEGLKLARRLNIKHLELESDSQTLISWIKSKEADNNPILSKLDCDPDFSYNLVV